MRWARIHDEIVEVITEQTSAPALSGGWVDVTDIAVGPGWRRDGDEWLPPEAARQTILTHREFILRLGAEYISIERLRETNAALSPDAKNYDLVRLFAIWDRSEFIDLDDPDLIAAFSAFVDMGLMTRERADEILKN